MAPLKTPMHSWHAAHGAHLAVFGGYEMPMWYGSARGEHEVVLTRAGIFDTSHMAVVQVDGPGALELLQFCFTNDLSACLGKSKAPLKPGRAVYGAFLTADGHVLDDAIVFMLEEAAFMVVVNAGMGPAVARHLERYRDHRRVRIMNLSGQAGKIDVQGPLAARIMGEVLRSPERVFESMPYFAFKGGFGDQMPIQEPVFSADGLSLLISRTGYTGEFGFEIFAAASDIVGLWETIVAAGRRHGAQPCGLAARDSLRAGAVLPLARQDIGDWPFCRHPWPFALPYLPTQKGFRKPFLGDAALDPCRGPYTYPFVGHDVRKVTLPARVFDDGGQPIGDVLTCVTDMAIGWHAGRIVSMASPDRPDAFKAGGLCCGFVKVSVQQPRHARLRLKDRRRQIDALVVDDIRPDRTARQPLLTML